MSAAKREGTAGFPGRGWEVQHQNTRGAAPRLYRSRTAGCQAAVVCSLRAASSISASVAPHWRHPAEGASLETIHPAREFGRAQAADGRHSEVVAQSQGRADKRAFDALDGSLQPQVVGLVLRLAEGRVETGIRFPGGRI